jgi:hypothetical protein
MVTNRNRRTPLGNCALIPANTEVVRDLKPGIGDDSERLNTLASGGQPKRSVTVAAVVREISYRTMFRRSSGPLSGVNTSKPKRGRLSVNKGTREARSSRVITQPLHISVGQASPTRRMSGGVAVVIRGWESQPHGEGRQEVSVWTVEGFINREGSR